MVSTVGWVSGWRGREADSLLSYSRSTVVGMTDGEVGNVRAVAGSDLVEAYEEALLVMARRESGDSSMTLDEAERWYHGQRAARGEGASRLGTITAPTAAG